jgi:hypothetical protein
MRATRHSSHITHYYRPQYLRLEREKAFHVVAVVLS